MIAQIVVLNDTWTCLLCIIVQYVYKYACNLIKVHIHVIIILNVKMGGVKIVKVCWIPFRGGVWVLNTTFWQIGDLQTGTQTQYIIYIYIHTHILPMGIYKPKTFFFRLHM